MRFQVPRSSKELYEDNEYALYTVTLFGCVADNFRTSALERGFRRSLSNGKQSGRADGTSSGSPSSASSKRGYEKKRGSSSMEEKDTLVSAKALIGDSVTILHGGRGVYLFLSLLSFIA
ncbi:uncharacterized protein LOC111310437 isoform X4 [Durio zibethinus]|uniref:V-type proton ATPase subunit C n=1 Tax=Durio zibethinus TaxID=66656 RepID=A0A6P6ALD7_DURZI|nr:uncharacterized protein LOC111310437 isoform X4 [Durio zibethinus]